jgi:hypothetical protein
MSLTLTGSESVFVRAGHAIETVNLLDDFVSSTSADRVALIEADYTTTDAGAVEGVYSDHATYSTQSAEWLSTLAQKAAAGLVAQVDREVGVRPVGSEDRLTATLRVLVREMVAQSASISAPTVSASATYGASNAGTTRFLVDVKNGEGYQTDYAFAETLTATCTQIATTTLTGSDLWTVTGSSAVSPTDSSWPKGSGTSFTVPTLNPSTLGTPNVTDGGFEVWADANSPTNWTAAVGVGGTNFVRSSTALAGTYSLQLLSASTTVTRLYQAVNLLPLTTYAVGLWVRKSANDASGTVLISLTDSTGTATTDEAGTANTITAALASGGPLSTTAWTFVGGFFRTPRRVEGLQIRVGWGVLPANGVSAYCDQLLCEQGTVAYPGGPTVALVGGGVSPGLGDSASAAIANSGTKDTFGRSLDRLWGLRLRGIRLPTSGSPTISNSLIA